MALDKKLPIAELIDARCGELGITRGQLVARMYGNAGKGYRRLAQLVDGDLDAASGFVERLPAALVLPEETVRQAVQASRLVIEEAELLAAAEAEAAWRAEFRPHAIIIAERRVPEPIFVAAAIGVDALLRVDFDVAAGEASYVEQAKAGVAAKLRRWGGPALPAFGRPVGFVLNYSPDRAACCDLDGNIVHVLDRAHRIGGARLYAARLALTAAVLPIEAP